MNKNSKILLVGYGNMGSAMLKGWLVSGISPKNITILDPDIPLSNLPNDILLYRDALSCSEQNYDFVVLAVKPQLYKSVSKTLIEVIKIDTCLISIMAGIDLNHLTLPFNTHQAAIRAMPNLASKLSLSASALIANSHASDEQKDFTDKLFKAIGISEWVETEEQFHAVTAISGSGPAYYFLLSQIMIEKAIELGLPKETAQRLVAQTAYGAGATLYEGEEASLLVRSVASPKGTTEAALKVFNKQDNLRDLTKKAIQSAYDRSIELSKE